MSDDQSGVPIEIAQVEYQVCARGHKWPVQRGASTMDLTDDKGQRVRFVFCMHCAAEWAQQQWPIIRREPQELKQ
jgi:hypothetical protein